MEAAFLNGVFPMDTAHEQVCGNTEHATACSGFVSGLLSVLMQNGDGIEPDRVIFIHLSKDKDVLWVMEEALKCVELAAVIGELRGIDFKQSLRLQLAGEQSRVAGFILRNRFSKMRVVIMIKPYSWARWYA